MSHEIEWRDVLVGTQVFANGYAWVVEIHVGDELTLYSPKLDKRHVGRPKTWNKVTVLTPDDPRYAKGWAEQVIEVTAAQGNSVTPGERAHFAEMLLVVKLGSHEIGTKLDGQDWWTPEFEAVSAEDKRLHLVYFHRVDSSSIEDADLDQYHLSPQSQDVQHTHGKASA